MIYFKLLVVLLCASISIPSVAYIENSFVDRYAGLDSMNGYKFDTYKSFEKKWTLVTVRYRVDSGELRFTYANNLAWKTMLAGKTDYPDGSIFAKTGYITEDDPAFVSSKVPSGARRYQFMIKNKKLHADHDGWGYALFDGTGKTFAEDPKVKIESCAACHRLVPDRGFVFSQPMDPSLFIKTLQAGYKYTDGPKFTYDTISFAKLSSEMKMALIDSTSVLLLSGPIKKNIFQGTLDEIIPSLMQIAEKEQLPAGLANDALNRFTLVKFVKRLCLPKPGFEILQTQMEKETNGTHKVSKRVVCK